MLVGEGGRRGVCRCSYSRRRRRRCGLHKVGRENGRGKAEGRRWTKKLEFLCVELLRRAEASPKRCCVRGKHRLLWFMLARRFRTAVRTGGGDPDGLSATLLYIRLYRRVHLRWKAETSRITPAGGVDSTRGGYRLYRWVWAVSTLHTRALLLLQYQSDCCCCYKGYEGGNGRIRCACTHTCLASTSGNIRG